MIIGIVWGFTALILGVLFAKSSLLFFIDLPSMMITVGGSVAALMVGYPLKKLVKLPTFMRVAIFPQSYNLSELIVTIVSFSEKARREGLLALEDDLEELDDPYMKKGLQLIVDGTDPELVRNILENEVEQMVNRHDDNKRIFDDWSTWAPAFGMIGTLMGLVMMLVNLSDRASVGPYLAVAIITTFYGAVLCYLIFQPVASRLDCMTNDEVLYRAIIVMGVLAIQSGDNPRIVKDKLITFMPPAARAELAEEVKD
ncbi:MAG: motility protein A [Spirochaetes bacterium]|nr:motility protein A [Spirochaetota bacterium]